MALLLLLSACARDLHSCGASIMIFGPTYLFVECPPKGWFDERELGVDPANPQREIIRN